MGKFVTLTKWSIKMGAVGGAVYYAGQERIFGTPAETKAAVDKVKKQINECEHLQMIPRPEMPELVTSTFGSWKDTSFKRSWNNGVLYTFTAINHLPNTVRELTNYAWEAMNNQGQGQGEEKSGQDKAKSGQDEAKGGQEKKDKKE